MKKLIALFLVLVVCCSLCACSNAVEEQNGVPVDTGVLLDENNVEVVVTEKYISHAGQHYHYFVVMECDGYRFMFDVGDNEFLFVEIGETIVTNVEISNTSSNGMKAKIAVGKTEWVTYSCIVLPD